MAGDAAIRHARERFAAEWDAQAAAMKAFTLFCDEWFGVGQDAAVVLTRSGTAQSAWENLCVIRPGLGET